MVSLKTVTVDPKQPLYPSSTAPIEPRTPAAVIEVIEARRAVMIGEMNYHLGKAGELREAIDCLESAVSHLAADGDVVERYRPSGSRFLDYGQMRGGCLQAMQNGAIVCTMTVVGALMRQKGLNEDHDPELRRDLNKRALRAMHSLEKLGRVEKIREGSRVFWRLGEGDAKSNGGQLRRTRLYSDRSSAGSAA